MTDRPTLRAAFERVVCSLAVFVLIAVGAACSGAQAGVNPAGPSVSTSPGATFATSPATIQTRMRGKVVPRTVTGELGGRFAFIPTGDEWWEFYAASESTGTLTHLGLSRMYTKHTPDFLTSTLQEATFRIVAANGDEIWGTYEGAVTFDPVREDLVHGTATFTITGGSGRFLEASGSFNVTFLETLDDPTWASAKVVWTLSGTVNY